MAAPIAVAAEAEAVVGLLPVFPGRGSHSRVPYCSEVVLVTCVPYCSEVVLVTCVRVSDCWISFGAFCKDVILYIDVTVS